MRNYLDKTKFSAFQCCQYFDFVFVLLQVIIKFFRNSIWALANRDKTAQSKLLQALV